MRLITVGSDKRWDVKVPDWHNPVFLPVIEKRRGGGPKPLTAEERVTHFWSRIEPDFPLGCWLWQGGTTRDGYGLLQLGRLEDGRVVNDYAHRVAYQLTHGPIASGLVIRHSCDTPPCCNPAHLLSGTQADNIADAQRQGKYKCQRPGRWVVDPAIRADLISQALNGPKGTVSRLAREYGFDARSFMVVVWRARQKQQRQRRLLFGTRRSA
jgi:hypothetical protein